MDVENAEILHIGEIKETKSGHKMLSVDVKMPNGGVRKTFVVYQNRVNRYDLVKLFKTEFFKVGQTVSFNFNPASSNWQFDSIWDLKLRDRSYERQE
jgi:hypothetical protein